MQWNAKIIVLGAGDLGTASGIRLFRSGLRPLLVDSLPPSDLHAFRNFSDLVYTEKKQVDDIDGIYLGNIDNSSAFNRDCIINAFDNRKIPLVSGAVPDILALLEPEILIDCREHMTDTSLPWQDFPCVIKIGTKYNVAIDGHIIIGYGRRDQGRVYYKPHNQHTDDPESGDTILAPLEGIFVASISAGEQVKERQVIGNINDINILSPKDGYITGILHSGHFIYRHQPMVEIHATGSGYTSLKEIPLNCIAVSGGVLEAVMAYLRKSTAQTW